MCILLVFVILLAATTVDCQICSITSDTSDNDFEGSTYEFHHGNNGVYKTFQEVRTYCQGRGGDIVVITSEAQNDFIAGKLLKNAGRAHYWIGLHDMNGDGTYTWADGQGTGFTNWASDTSTDPNNRCVAIIASSNNPNIHGQWEYRACSLPHRYICQIVLPNPLFQSHPHCSWQLFGDSYYRFIGGTKRNFDDAQNYCVDEGGELAIIRSDDLNEYLTTFITPPLSNNECYWIGLRDDEQNEGFIWIDGTPLTNSDSIWATGEPNNSDEDCACLWSYTNIQGYEGHGMWNDDMCLATNPFICQRDRLLQGRWTQLGNTQYMVTSRTSTYSDAREYCQQLGGTLAQPKTRQIQDLLVTLESSEHVWIGLDDIDTEGVFRWADGTLLTMTGYAGWGTDNPDNHGGNEHCVHQSIDFSNVWNDNVCTETFKAACERSRAPPLHVLAVTSTPYGGMGTSPQYSCLVSIPHNSSDSITYTERLVKLSQSTDARDVPGEATNISLSEPVRQTLPTSDSQAVGAFTCTATSPTEGTSTSASVTILSQSGNYYPSDGRFTKTVYPGDDITLSVRQTSTQSPGQNEIRWRKFSNLDLEPLYGSDGSLSHSIVEATMDDAAVYGTYQDTALQNYQYSLIRVIVSACPEGKWNLPRCDRNCDICYNGGICHPQSGTCICAPGFAGKHCLRACGEHRFGWECEFQCGLTEALNVCAGSQVCLPDPFGCNCLSGYTGVYCNETCPAGSFGSDCLLHCHCAGGEPCDVFTGVCSAGCDVHWTGEGCQVPIDCPAGRFGAECTEYCNCPDGGSCDKDLGYCKSTDGECQTGFIHNSAVYPESCTDYTGCFTSCSETCHCWGGFDDCNLINGECFSSRCHPRWMGNSCQTDRFQAVSAKANPGTAAFSCAVSSSDAVLSAEDIKAVVGGFSGDNTKASHISSDVQDLTRNNTFFIEDVNYASIIYCFIGDPADAMGFAFVKLPDRTFYELPSLSETPTVGEPGLTYVVMQWRAWNSTVDSGEGPITGYRIYIQRSGEEFRDVIVPSSGEVQTSGGSRKKRAGSGETNSSADGTDLPAMLEYNITGLSEGTTYTIQLAVIREGPGGEGERGAPVTFTTMTIMNPTTTPQQTTTSPLTKQPGATESVASLLIVPAVGGIFGAIILILVIVIVIILVRRKRAQQASDKPMPALHLQVPNDYHDLEGQSDDFGKDIPPVPVSRSTSKPMVAVKPRLKQANSTDSVDEPLAKASPDPSGVPMPSSRREPIPAAAFPAFVHKHRHTSFFSDEFKDLPAEDIYPQTAAREEENFEKNRYRNILPYDSGRVILDVLDGDPHSDYYNATYISSFDRERVYIASQAPNKASIDDFWRMVWQENIRTIAMVTRLQEGRKIKCKQYWPENPGDSIIFGSIKVELIDLEPCTGGQKRKLVMRKGKDSEQRTVHQFHYTEWPDKGVPKHISSLLKFIKEVKADHAQNTDPLLIHCSAGVGRTGVVIGIDSIVAHARQAREVDVFNFVSAMRERRPFMIQTQEQYAFLYGAVLESLLWRDTSIPIKHFTDHLRRLRLVEGGRSHLVREYETLNSLCPDPPASLVKVGKLADNRHKNRYGNKVPLDRNRVILKRNGEDYINASFLKGARYRFLTTQMPMPTTVTDFWTMILDYGPLCVVMLNDLEPKDKSYAEYWSDEGLATFDSYQVSATVDSQQSDVIIRTMEVTRSDSKAGHRLTHLQFLNWPKKAGPSQKSAKGLLSVIETVKSSMDVVDDFAILVHCMSGVGRTGVFCSAMECIAQVDQDESIDVFQTVKMLRADRTGLVQTEHEYSFLYDVMSMYLQTNDYEQMPYDQEEHTYGNMETVPQGAVNVNKSIYEVVERDQPGPDALFGNSDVEGSHGQTPSMQRASPRDTAYENFSFQS